jgi:hypothetical protein
MNRNSRSGPSPCSRTASIYRLAILVTSPVPGWTEPFTDESPVLRLGQSSEPDEVMAKLFGAQRVVLQAFNDLPKEPSGYVADNQIALHTRIEPSDVRDWLDTLDGEGLIEVTRTGVGLSASITAKGRLALGQSRPTPPRGRAPSGRWSRQELPRLDGPWWRRAPSIGTHLSNLPSGSGSSQGREPGQPTCSPGTEFPSGGAAIATSL